MKPVLMAGMTIVNLALLSYTIAIILQRRKKIMSSAVLIFLTTGVVFDITATICMVAGSSQGALTLHGIIGYTSLAGMLTDTVFSYLLRFRNGKDAAIPARFNKNSLLAYCYWILAYITGAILIMLR